ncbi:MAG: hypothetical protein JO341_12710 [Gammaproteobacteria bacterium]|nr:hypothetical protein [Gammaproteobacteria bacterium]
MLTREEVVRTCDELHACIEQGPGENPGVLARTLGLLRHLREHAAWDYPLGRLRELEVQLARWFSPAVRADDEDARRKLLEEVARLEDAWERPRA